MVVSPDPLHLTATIPTMSRLYLLSFGGNISTTTMNADMNVSEQSGIAASSRNQLSG